MMFFSMSSSSSPSSAMAPFLTPPSPPPSFFLSLHYSILPHILLCPLPHSFLSAPLSFTSLYSVLLPPLSSSLGCLTPVLLPPNLTPWPVLSCSFISFFTSSFFHPVVCFLLLYCFTNQVYRVLRSAGIRMWFTVRLSLCLLGFFLISVFPHTAQGQGKYHCCPAVHSRINNPSSPHWAQAELFIHSPAGLTMKFPNDTPQGKPELSDRVLNCQDLHMYRFSPV